jgi:hypothetical protein
VNGSTSPPRIVGGPVGLVFRYLYAFDRFTREGTHSPYVKPRLQATERRSQPQKWGNGFLPISRQRLSESSRNFAELSKTLTSYKRRQELPQNFPFPVARKLTI